MNKISLTIRWFFVLVVLLSACAQPYTSDSSANPTETSEIQQPTETSLPSEPTPTPGITPSPFPDSPLRGNVWFYGFLALDGWGWPPNADIEIYVTASDGSEKIVITATTDSGGNIPWTELDTPLTGGDLITLSLRDDQLQFPFPEFTAIADVETSTVTGNAQPFAKLLLTLEHPKDNWINIETYADEEGNYLFEVPPDPGWEINDTLLIGQFAHTNIVMNIAQINYVDPLVANNELYEVLTFSAPTEISPGNSASTLIDFDSDGDLDLVLQVDNGPAPGTLLAFRNDGHGNFTDATAEVFGELSSEFEKPRHWAVADFNGDGKDDIFFAMQGIEPCDPCLTEPNRIFIQNDKGQLVDESEARIPQEVGFSHNTSAGDIDNDGDVDIYVGNWPGHTPEGPRFYINDGAGFFTDDPSRLPSAIASGTGGEVFSACELVDVDNDGDLDLVVGYPASDSGPISVQDTLLLNDGTGQFSYAPQGSLPPRADGGNVEEVGISSIDFNNDGFADLVIALQHVVGVEPDRVWTDPKLQLLINNGDGTFRDETSLIDIDWSKYVHPGRDEDTNVIDWSLIVDYNNDDWLDIVTIGYNVFPVLFENLGGEGFEVVEVFGRYRINYETGFPVFRDWDGGSQRFPSFAIPGDLDNDGDIDYILIFEGQFNIVLLTK